MMFFQRKPGVKYRTEVAVAGWAWSQVNGREYSSILGLELNRNREESNSPQHPPSIS